MCSAFQFSEKDANHPKTSERKLQDQNKTEKSFEQMKEIRTEISSTLA